MSAEKHVVVPDTRQPQPHKQGCISKNISKIFLEILLEIDVCFGARIFRGSNKKEPKTLVNTGVSASFIAFYHRAKSVIFWPVDVPWKPFGAQTPRGFESHTLRQQKTHFCLPTKVRFLNDVCLAAHWANIASLRNGVEQHHICEANASYRRRRCIIWHIGNFLL